MIRRNIRSPFTGQLYMQRRYLWGAPYMPDGSSPFNEFGDVREDAVRTPGTQCFLHKITSSDDRLAVHNHPWQWAKSLILAGGYSEQRYFADLDQALTFFHKRRNHTATLRRYGDAGWIVRHTVKPGDVVHLDGETFHRLDLIKNRPARTLFLAGPIKSGWGFLEPSGKFTIAREYLKTPEVRATYEGV